MCFCALFVSQKKGINPSKHRWESCKGKRHIRLQGLIQCGTGIGSELLTSPQYNIVTMTKWLNKILPGMNRLHCILKEYGYIFLHKHRNWHKKNQPGSQDMRKTFLNKRGSQKQNLKRTVGLKVISIFHQCIIQADHRKLTVEVCSLCQDPACLATPHKEGTQWCFRMERGHGAAR